LQDLGYTLINVGSHIWSERHRVNHDVIFAAVSAFLLLGIVWTYAYFFLDMANPLSFKGPQAELNRDDFFYFSFVRDLQNSPVIFGPSE